MNKVHDIKIPVAEPIFGNSEAKAVYEVVKSGWVTMGEKVSEFEKKFAQYVEAKHAIAMFNGTVTLHSALLALEINPNDEVITPSLTYISTANVVLYVGAKLNLCESDPDTYNVDVDKLKSKITPQTKAIIVVDMNGLPVNYDEILSFAAENNLFVIADSAESLGAIYKKRPVGNQALMHSFSFFGNKNITTGEGGMITTNDDEIASRLKIIRNQGQDTRYNHICLGHNFRMTELQAALGIEQLKNLNKTLKQKEFIVKSYNDFFENCSVKNFIKTPYIPDFVTRHSWYMYTLSLSDKLNRDEIANQLEKVGIETRKSFPPVHIQPFHSKLLKLKENDFPLCYSAWKKLINLPITPRLNKSKIEYICKNLERIILEQLS